MIECIDRQKILSQFQSHKVIIFIGYFFTIDIVIIEIIGNKSFRSMTCRYMVYVDLSTCSEFFSIKSRSKARLYVSDRLEYEFRIHIESKNAYSMYFTIHLNISLHCYQILNYYCRFYFLFSFESK